MPIIFISNVLTLTDNAEPMFKGQAGIDVIELTIKARTNGLTILSNNEYGDGFRIGAGDSFDILTHEGYDQYDLNHLYWKNTVIGTDCIVEVFGKRRI